MNKVLILLLFVLLSSCATKKEILYLQDAEYYDGTGVIIENPKIQIDNILQVNISAFPKEIAEPYNRSMENTNRNSGGQNNIIDGYLVSYSGFITLPILGDIKAVGKTTDQLQTEIVDILISGGHFVDNPIVEVRVLNRKFTVLGEVKNPGTFTYLENNYNILQAVGKAGDLSINGKRDNILLMREIDGERMVTRLDLTSADIVLSPYYLIKPNDVIYVNPNGPKVKSAGYIGNLGSLLSVFSIVLSTTLILTR